MLRSKCSRRIITAPPPPLSSRSVTTPAAANAGDDDGSIDAFPWRRKDALFHPITRTPTSAPAEGAGPRSFRQASAMAQKRSACP